MFFAKAIAKYFPDSEFAALDLTNLSSKWVNESEKNIQSAVEEICEQAKSNPEKKFFVFIDEIDSVMMIHEGSSSAFHSNSVLNEFKRCFTDKLGAHENIVTIAATNLEVIDKNPMGKKLDKAMLDRFQEKIYIPLPTKEQLLSAISKLLSPEMRITPTPPVPSGVEIAAIVSNS